MKLIINPKAELKLRIAMAHAKNYEIMWFGEIHKNRKGNYILKDVIFPPQINQPAFVETKDEEYPKWSFENITKKKKTKVIRLHGHTHPTFKPTPSPVDQKHIETFIKETDDFFIQIILSNLYPPYSVIHFKEKDGVRTEPISIVWNYTLKLKKILVGVMNIHEHK